MLVPLENASNVRNVTSGVLPDGSINYYGMFYLILRMTFTICREYWQIGQDRCVKVTFLETVNITSNL